MDLLFYFGQRIQSNSHGVQMPKNKQNTLHKGAVTFLQQLLTWEILQALIQSRKTFVILCNIFPGVALKIKNKTKQVQFATFF